ncbi:MAG: hypothetical protein ABUK01_18165 [Leptospirales bacterium]
MNFYLNFFENVYNKIEKKLHGKKADRYSSMFFLMSFGLALGIIQLNNMGLLPHKLAKMVPLNHFSAIDLVLSLILLKEFMDMIFALSDSVSRAQRKQLEVVSLILLRSSFKTLPGFNEIDTMDLAAATEQVLPLFTYGFSAFIIFLIVLMYYRLQNIPMLSEDKEMNSFVAAKKLVALMLLLNFIIIGVFDVIHFFIYWEYSASFDTFFKVFLFADIIIVLISLGYGQLYVTVFRNTGFALVTVLILVSLAAPQFFQELISILAAAFAYALAYAYNRYCILCTIEPSKDYPATR